MFTVPLLLVCLTAALASSTPLDHRIVGGRNGTIEEVPYQVSLLREGWHHCGGSIISEFWVVTAAHCFRRDDYPYSVRVGSSLRTSGGVIHEIETYIRHASWGIPHNHVNDIGVFKVVHPFQFSAQVQPIALPAQSEQVNVGDVSTISGYGYLNWAWGPSATVVQIAEVPIIDQEVCRNAYITENPVTDDMMCAGFLEGGIDACQGDSGGPLVIDGVLQGTVSWGRRCAARGFPGVYARVSFFRDWIHQQTGL